MKREIDEQRAIALNRAFVTSRLLEEKYFPRILESLKQGKEGEENFIVICKEAGIPRELVKPTWMALTTYASATKAPWAPC